MSGVPWKLWHGGEDFSCGLVLPITVSNLSLPVHWDNLSQYWEASHFPALLDSEGWLERGKQFNETFCKAWTSPRCTLDQSSWFSWYWPEVSGTELPRRGLLLVRGCYLFCSIRILCSQHPASDTGASLSALVHPASELCICMLPAINFSSVVTAQICNHTQTSAPAFPVLGHVQLGLPALWSLPFCIIWLCHFWGGLRRKEVSWNLFSALMASAIRVIRILHSKAQW